MQNMAFNKNENIVINHIKDNYKVMVLMRGLPGSGKSTLARNIIVATNMSPPSMFIFSTDDYFKRNGKYVYDVTQISFAHSWNQTRVKDSIESGLSPIIVDNTNLELWEMKWYTEYAVKHGYIIEVLHSTTHWAMKPNILVNKSCHKVPLMKIKQMVDKYQFPGNLNGKNLLSILGICYDPKMQPPRLCNLPPVIRADISEKKSAETVNGPLSNSLTNTTGSSWGAGSNLISIAELNGDQPRDPGVQESPVSNDSLLDTWEVVKTSKDNKPKPQRTDYKFGLKSSLAAESINLVDWEPIDHRWNPQNTNDTEMISIECVPKSVAENCTMTENIENLMNSTDEVFYKILTGENRDIFEKKALDNVPNIVRSKLMLDKGITVNPEDIATSSSNGNTQMQLLNECSSIFENIPLEYMNHFLNKCGGNVNWAADLLMDTNTELNVSNVSQKENGETPQYQEDYQIAGPSNISKGKNSKTVFKDKNKDKVTSEDATMLKKQIESNFDFGEEMYSEHCLKLKQKIHGKPAEGTNAEMINGNSAEEMHFDRQRSSSESSDEVEETVEFNLGFDCLNQIEEIFGLSPMITENFKPVINMPISMVNQIYALWMESINNQKKQLDTLMKEDEELAMQLQALECQKDSESLVNKTPNIQAIMDMELAWAYYDSDQIDQPEQPTDLATKLTHQKLVEMFPEIERNTLIEIYHAYHNNFSITLEALLVSTGKISREVASSIDDETMKQILITQEQNLLDRAKKATEMVTINVDSDDDEHSEKLDEEQIKASIEAYREQARYHLKIRNQNYNKARECIAKGMHQAALYYSNIASLHTNKIEKANASAASRVFQLNFSNSNDKKTINLHTLHLQEAMHLLDIFIDKHIMELREKNLKSETLFIITGRGKHSYNNKPVIKPATKKRLLERGLIYCVVNPGVYRTQVSRASLLSDEIIKAAA